MQRSRGARLGPARMHEIALHHVTVGFNSALFDCPAVMAQNAKYENLETEFRHHLDFRWLPGVRGRLAQVAAEYGIEESPNHRALADALVLAKLLDRMVSDLSVADVACHIETVRDEDAFSAGQTAQQAAERNEARGRDLEALGALDGEEALRAFVALKAQEKQLKQELEALRPNVCAFVRAQGGKARLEDCSVSHQSRPKYRFSEAVDELKGQLDALKKQEIADGVAEEDGQSEYVTVRWR